MLWFYGIGSKNKRISPPMGEKSITLKIDDGAYSLTDFLHGLCNYKNNPVIHIESPDKSKSEKLRRVICSGQ